MAIELKSQRGQIGVTFLGRELGRRVETLFGSRGRATGKRAARDGAVAWIDVRPGVVSASVDDPIATAVTAEISFRVFRADEQEAFRERCAQQPDLLLSVLDGSFDADREQWLLADELSLLPSSLEDVSFDCTCGLGLSVCPHVYALVYVLVEHVDAAPADLLVLRGMSVEQLHSAPEGEAAGGEAADAGAFAGGAPVGEAATDAPLPPRDKSTEIQRSQSVTRATTLGEVSDDTGAAVAGSARFIPAQLDADILLEMVSDQTRDLFVEFYRSGSSVTDSAPE